MRDWLVVFVTLGVVTAAAPAAGNPRIHLPTTVPVSQRAVLERLATTADVATRVEAEPFLVRAAVFEYLLDHPEFATHVARTLRLARFRIWNTPSGMVLDDGRGLTGQFRIVYAANGTRLFHANGEYNTALLPTIRGQALTMIEYHTSPAPKGRVFVKPAVSGFVRLDNRVLAFGFRVLHAAAQRKAELEARRLMKKFARVSRALDESPEAVLEQLRQAPGVPTRELEEFGRLLNGR
ncbi:MAG: hypothetical protein ACREJV_12085 [Candidatus Rokuibacteriota bacterium]